MIFFSPFFVVAIRLDAAKILDVDIKHDKDSYVCTVHYMYKYVCVLCACEVGADIHIKSQATQHDCLPRLLGVGDTVKSVR